MSEFSNLTQVEITSWGNVPLICAVYSLPHPNIPNIQDELADKWEIILNILLNHIEIIQN
jgi:hypothetical protein